MNSENFWKGKNVFITGITGFVGSYLAEKLVVLEANVSGLYRRRADFSKPAALAQRGILDEVELIEGDLTDITSVATALRSSKPDYIFHLGAQSYVPRSFIQPLETININVIGSANLLEAIRFSDLEPKVVFAGSSEEYGLVLFSEKQYENVLRKYGVIYPVPEKIPELPINEKNPLRPLSPYATSKVNVEYMMRNYYYCFGLRTVISRGFNTEGAGRGAEFVTSVITRQVMKLKFDEAKRIVIGNVNAFRDWSHVKDIVDGYLLLAEKGQAGETYNQGSMRTNSILSYILLSLEQAKWNIIKIESIKNGKSVTAPLERDFSKLFGVEYEKTKVDKLMLEGNLEYTVEDEGIMVHTDKGQILIEFDRERFRPADVPILMSDTGKIQQLGYEIRHTLQDIISDQLNYFLDKKNRELTLI